MYKGNKGDRHAGLHYQCVIEVSGNINANANIKVFQIKLEKHSESADLRQAAPFPHTMIPTKRTVLHLPQC